MDLIHYLKTLRKKPGALKNSLALKQCPQLQSIYQNHFKQNEREFIDILLKNSNKQLSELSNILLDTIQSGIRVNKSEEVIEATKMQLSKLNEMFGFQNEKGDELPCQLKH